MKKLIAVLILGISLQAMGQTKAQLHYNLNEDGVAIDGYDPVSYFEGEPHRGRENISYQLDGVIYWFVTEENKVQFKKAPLKYMPQYGGWCAYALGLNPEKVKVDPETYKIVDGKLYLFYNFYLTNTLKSWNKDETRLKANADKNWDIIINN